MTARFLTLGCFIFISNAALAMTSSLSDRECVARLNAISDRIYAQQQNLTQVTAQIGDEEIVAPKQNEQAAASRVGAVNSEILRRERAQRSISVMSQLVYGQRAGVASMTYTHALKDARVNFSRAENGGPAPTLGEIERAGKDLKARYANCANHVPTFNAFVETVLKNRGTVTR